MWTNEEAKRAERRMKRVAERIRKEVIAHPGDEIMITLWWTTKHAIERITNEFAIRGIRK